MNPKYFHTCRPWTSNDAALRLAGLLLGWVVAEAIRYYTRPNQ